MFSSQQPGPTRPDSMIHSIKTRGMFIHRMDIDLSMQMDAPYYRSNIDPYATLTPSERQRLQPTSDPGSFFQFFFTVNSFA